MLFCKPFHEPLLCSLCFWLLLADDNIDNATCSSQPKIYFIQINKNRTYFIGLLSRFAMLSICWKNKYWFSVKLSSVWKCNELWSNSIFIRSIKWHWERFHIIRWNIGNWQHINTVKATKICIHAIIISTLRSCVHTYFGTSTISIFLLRTVSICITLKRFTLTSDPFHWLL